MRSCACLPHRRRRRAAPTTAPPPPRPVEYDEHDQPIVPAGKQEAPLLPAVDHAAVAYAPFRKAFYTPVPSVRAGRGVARRGAER